MSRCDCEAEMPKMYNLDQGGGQRGGTPAGLRTAVPTGGVSSRAWAAAGAAAGLPKVITAVLVEDELYKTDGTATYVVDLFDLEQLRTLGPMIQQIRVHYVAENATSANFRAKVSTSWSVLGKVWSASVDLLAGQTGSQTGTISSWYTTDANFGLLMRYGIEVSNASGTAIESARLTVVLEIELKS